jgi:hypothetical protein
LTNKINAEGKMYALTCSLMGVKAVNDRSECMSIVVSQLNKSMKSSQMKEIQRNAYRYDNLPDMLQPDTKVRSLLNYICKDLDKDLVVFFDEADCLTDTSLVTFLSQIRDAYNERDEPGNKFPRSMALVGLRDIRDYLAQIRPDTWSKGIASPFNIKKKALTLANFTEREIRTLYQQHTGASGQVFEESATAQAWYWSAGQPWLVNALAYQVIVEELTNDYSVTVTGTLIDKAAEVLIQRRDTHIDSLVERLKEPRVARVMDSVFAGTNSKVPIDSDDRRFCLDLGLVKEDEDRYLHPANPLYQEVMSRVITDQIQYSLSRNISTLKWTDGKIIFVSDLLKEFQTFWRHDSESFPLHKQDYIFIKYDEATYSFILLSFLQRAVNSGAKLHRQFAEGRGAVDISLNYKEHEYLIEVKLHSSKALKDGLEQLSRYLNSNGGKEAWLVIFDRDSKKDWDDKISFETIQHGKYMINIVKC